MCIAARRFPRRRAATSTATTAAARSGASRRGTDGSRRRASRGRSTASRRSARTGTASSMRRRSAARSLGFLSAVALVLAAGASAAPRAASGHDWLRFGWSPSRSSAPTFATGITAANVKSLVRQQVGLDGTVDSSPIYLHGVKVGAATHDVIFVTTTYGKTEAIDAANGSVLGRFTPPGYSAGAGSPQITTATPVADPGRQVLYGAGPDRRSYKPPVAAGQPGRSGSDHHRP